MRKVVLTLSAVLVFVALTFAGCNNSEKKTTGTKSTKTKSSAPTTVKKAPTTPTTK